MPPHNVSRRGRSHLHETLRTARPGAIFLVTLTSLLCAVSCSRPPANENRRLETELIGTEGAGGGSAVLEETQAGVRVTLSVDSKDIAPAVTLGDGDNSLIRDGGTTLEILELGSGGERLACGAIRSPPL